MIDFNKIRDTVRRMVSEFTKDGLFMSRIIKIGISLAAFAAMTLSLTGCSTTCDVCGNSYSDDATTTMTIKGEELNICVNCTKSVKTCDICQDKYLSGGTTATVLGREVTVCSDCTKSATLGILG